MAGTVYGNGILGCLIFQALMGLSNMQGGDSPDYIKEGALFNVHVFSHVSDRNLQRLNARTSWRVNGTCVDQSFECTRLITRSMNNKNLTYKIYGENHDPIVINYLLQVSYTGPITLEPNRTSYMYTLPLDGTFQPITCVVICNPICNVKWKRGNVTVSETNILRSDAVLRRTSDYICQATNTETKKLLRERIVIYFADERDGESRALVYVFATLMAVFVLTTVALTVQLYRQAICNLKRPSFLQRAPKNDTLDMGVTNVAASSTDDNADIPNRPSATYEDLQNRGGQENLYEGIRNQNLQADDRNETYENLN